MGRSLKQILADLPSERRSRVETRYRELKKEVDGLGEALDRTPPRSKAGARPSPRRRPLKRVP